MDRLFDQLMSSLKYVFGHIAKSFDDLSLGLPICDIEDRLLWLKAVVKLQIDVYKKHQLQVIANCKPEHESFYRSLKYISYSGDC